MNTYIVYFTAAASTSVEIEAENEEEAADAAWEEFDVGRLCYHCSKKMDIGDWDFCDVEEI